MVTPLGYQKPKKYSLYLFILTCVRKIIKGKLIINQISSLGGVIFPNDVHSFKKCIYFNWR